LQGSLGPPHLDAQRVLVHWNHTVGNQQANVTPMSISGTKSDEEADDDDDGRTLKSLFAI